MTAGLSNESRALLERAKRQGGPTPAQTAKIGAAVFAATTASAATATATAAVTTASGGGAAVAASSSLITMIGAGLVATAIGIGGTVAVKHALAPPAPPPRVAPVAPAPPPVVPSVIVPAPATVAPSEEVPAPPVVVEAPMPVVRPAARVEVKREVVAAESTPAVPEQVQPIVPAPPAVAHHEQPVVDSTAAQVAALTAAVEALERHQPDVARSTARDARLADRTGVLAPELMVVEITALCELGRKEDALSLSRQMTAAEQTPLVRGKLGRTCVGTEK